MKKSFLLLIFNILLIVIFLAAAPYPSIAIANDDINKNKSSDKIAKNNTPFHKQFRGIVFAPQGIKNADDFVINFKKLVEHALVPLGINAIIFDMHWNNYNFTSTKELKNLSRKENLDFSKKHAAKLSKICKENNLDVIVGMNVLTHQNYGQFLKAFPNLKWPGLDNLWDPLDPMVNKIAFKMIDELINSFSPKAFHIGMDEGYDFNALTLPSNRDKRFSNSQLFAKVVNDFHEHIVGSHGLEIMMWSDMLENRHGIVDLENALNLINKEVIMVSWNYADRPEYPWPGKLMDKGFRVIVAPHKDLAAAKKFLNTAIRENNSKLIGILYTTWSSKVATDLRYALTKKADHTKNLDENMLGVAETIKGTIGLFQ
ncbi:MAG: hypothetical protein DSZ28_00880 [Thiothrix sp.]|nr:MAG: hypothetical protein DSZ28_00880 [Thiothrix sp.]